MPGFMAGFGQGFSQLPQMLDRREELKIRQAAAARQALLDQRKATGDLLSAYDTAIQSLPDDQIAGRTKLLFSEIENITGQKINPAVANIINSDPKSASKAMMQIYAEGPFDTKTLGNTLGDPHTFAAIFDAHNKRRVAQEAAAAYTSGFGGAQTQPAQGGSSVAVGNQLLGPSGASTSQPAQKFPGSTDFPAMQASLEKIDAAMQQISGMTGLDPKAQKDQLDALQKRAEFISKRMEDATNNARKMAAARMGIRFENASPQQLAQIEHAVITQMGLQKQAERAGETAATPLTLEQLQAMPGTRMGTTMGMIQQQNEMGGGVGTQPMAGIPTGPSAVTPQILDNLRQTESGGDRFAMNKQTKAMGPYQFLPETFIDMQRKGIVFNPLDEKQSRAAAEQYLNILLKQNGGDMRKALAAYGGFVKKDPTSYVNKVMGSSGSSGGSGGGGNVPLSQADIAQQREMSTDLGKQFLEGQKKSATAAARKARAETLQSYLEQVDTGALAGSVLKLQRGAEALGFDIPKSASYAEAANALSKAMAMEMRDPSEGAGSPGQITEWEAKNFEQMVAGIDHLEGANRLISRAYVANQQRAMDIAKLQREYVKSNGGKVDTGIFQVAEDYRAANPLFTPEEAEKVLQGTKKAPASTIKGSGKVTPFEDADKERRYQEWKKRQGATK